MNDTTSGSGSTPGASTVHYLAGAYAVDALDDAERSRFEAHLHWCADCVAEVESLRAAASELPVLTETTPPPSLRAKVLADIARVRPLPPVTEKRASAEPKVGDLAAAARARRLRLTRLAVAAAAVLAVVGGTVAEHPWDRSSTQQMTAIDQVLQAQDAVSETLRLPAGATATVVRSPSRHRAVMIGHALPHLRHGRVYQLWLEQPSGHMVRAGFLSAGAAARTLLDGDADHAVGAGITVEPAGGVSQPTTKPIALFSFKAAPKASSRERA